jgi:hypothetical protein
VVRWPAANLDSQLQVQRKTPREPLQLEFLPFAALALPYPCRVFSAYQLHCGQDFYYLLDVLWTDVKVR